MRGEWVCDGRGVEEAACGGEPETQAISSVDKTTTHGREDEAREEEKVEKVAVGKWGRGGLC